MESNTHTVLDTRELASDISVSAAEGFVLTGGFPAAVLRLRVGVLQHKDKVGGRVEVKGCIKSWPRQ